MMHVIYEGEAEAHGPASDGGATNCKTSSSRPISNSQSMRDGRWDSDIGPLTGGEPLRATTASFV